MERTELHPATADLVERFARALAEKLRAAEQKYGYSDGWLSPDWMDECRERLHEHIEKGDPRDVAAYCAFLWHHGEPTCRKIEPDPTEALTPPISQNDKRWRFLEHGCQWVSWTPIGGETRSFDPRNLTGYAGDLNDMRAQADKELAKQLETLRDAIKAGGK